MEVLSTGVLSTEVLSTGVLSTGVLSMEVLSTEVLSTGVLSTGEIRHRVILAMCRSIRGVRDRFDRRERLFFGARLGRDL